ncbi:MAG: uncharacterized membrane protein YhaH (DUF805 family) [Saprospiraceae bacterium]|jgi:uncharacterized membrane protein YhaH (DUF805 family)
MNRLYKIGKGSENDIVIRAQDCPTLHAEVGYERGYWVLTNLDETKAIFVNDDVIKSPRKLVKNDKLRICNQTVYWSNYLYEGENQELSLIDIVSLNGRISRSNFRALSLLAFGLTICIFFLPGVIVAVWEYLNRRRFREIEFDSVNAIQEIATLVYVFGISILAIIMLILGVKRIRDTGNPIWKLLIPICNLKLLYFEQSKK